MNQIANMFQSATLKLTSWYLFILMSIGLSLSFIIYQVASADLSNKLENYNQELLLESGETIILHGSPSVQTLQARQAATSLFTTLVYMNLLFLAVGGVASYIMARRTLEPIEQAHEAQSRFTSDASHELRTPLAAMKTEIEVALRDPSLSKEEMRELLSSNLEEVNKLTQITQSLLLLSRLDHSAIDTSRVAIDDIVRRLVENHNKQKPRVAYTAPENPLYITAHKVSIEELVTILVDNALKYSPPSSKVQVSLRKKGKKAEIKVTNTGKGISAEELPHIFDRFFRADESRTSHGTSGYGLGLSLAKRIVVMHKGDLSASSQPGKKTVFTVLLPLHERPNKRKRKEAKTTTV